MGQWADTLLFRTMGRYFIMLSFCSLGIYFITLFRDFFAALAKLSDVKIILPSLHWNSETFLLNRQILYFSAQWAGTLLCYLFAPWAYTLLSYLETSLLLSQSSQMLK